MINYSTDKYNNVYYFIRRHILLKYFNLDTFKNEHRYFELDNHILQISFLDIVLN